MNQDKRLEAIQLIIGGMLSNKTRQDIEKELINMGLSKKEALEELDNGLNAAKESGAPQELIDKFFFSQTNENDIEYFEVPVTSGDFFLCSDNECPCTDQKNLTPGINGYLYISPELVGMRKDCISWPSAQNKLIEMHSRKFGSNYTGIVTNGIINPIFLCETGAKKRKIDLEVAKADAKYWADNEMVPLRPSPEAKNDNTKKPGCLLVLIVLIITSIGTFVLF